MDTLDNDIQEIIELGDKIENSMERLDYMLREHNQQLAEENDIQEIIELGDKIENSMERLDYMLREHNQQLAEELEVFQWEIMRHLEIIKGIKELYHV